METTITILSVIAIFPILYKLIKILSKIDKRLIVLEVEVKNLKNGGKD